MDKHLPFSRNAEIPLAFHFPFVVAFWIKTVMEELWLDTLEDELFKEAVKFESYQFPIEILMKILSYGRVGKVCTSWMIADIACNELRL